jgi:nucleoid DNA-binding protein
VVEGFLASVIGALRSGDHIEIRGFGTFKVKLRKARKARNPRTGEVVPVPDRKVPVFKPSNEFKNMITKLEI